MIPKIIKFTRRLLEVPFLRFLVVGAVNAAFGYAIFALLILLGTKYVIAALLATICGILFNFKTTGTIVFKNKKNRLIFRFFGVYAIVYLINIGFLKIFDICGVSSLLAGAIIVVPLSFLSFLLMNKFVFRRLDRRLFK